MCWLGLRPSLVARRPLPVSVLVAMVVRLAPQILVSFVVCPGGQDDLTARLRRLEACGLPADRQEILLLAEPAGAGDNLQATHPRLRILHPTTELCLAPWRAALQQASGRLVLMLEGGRFPRPGCIRRMIDHFERDARLGAAVFSADDQDDDFPHVVARQGTAYRRQALRHMAQIAPDIGTDHYELSLRLLAADWEVRRFSDLRLDGVAQRPADAARQRMRSLVLLAARCFPSGWVMPYLRDWAQRGALLAARQGQITSWALGLAEGLALATRLRQRRPVTGAAFEKFAQARHIQSQLRRLATERPLRRLLLAGFGMNLYAFWRAAQYCGLSIVGVADRQVGGMGRRYRGIPLVDEAAARGMNHDAVLICSHSPAQRRQLRHTWQNADLRPVIDLLAPSDHSLTTPTAQAMVA
jgi:hypothetical protein